MIERDDRQPEKTYDEELLEILNQAHPGERAAELYIDARMRGLLVMREESLARSADRGRALAVNDALHAVARLAPREIRVSEKTVAGRPLRLIAEERRRLWLARAILGGRDEQDAEQHWDSHRRLLEVFFSGRPFTAGASEFDLDFTALLEAEPQRRAEVREAFVVLSTLAVPDLSPDERDRLLTDVVRTPSYPDGRRRRSSGLMDLRVRSCLAQARLSGVPPAVVESYEHAGQLDFRNPALHDHFNGLVVEMGRWVESRLKQEGFANRDRLGSFAYALEYLDDTVGIVNHVLRATMNGVRQGAFPREDPWRAAQLSRYQTFRFGLGQAIQKWRTATGGLGGPPPVVEVEQMTDFRVAVGDAAILKVAFQEAPRTTLARILTGPESLRAYYSIHNDADKERERCLSAVEASRYWLHAHAGTPSSTLEQLRVSVLAVVPGWDAQRRRRDLPFVAWTAKEFLDAFCPYIDGISCETLMIAQLRIRLAFLASLPGSVRSRTNQNPNATLAGKVIIPARAVLSEINTLLTTHNISAALIAEDDADLSLDALRTLGQALSEPPPYGELPMAAHRLANIVSATLHPRGQQP